MKVPVIFSKLFRRDITDPALCRTPAGHYLLRVLGAQPIPEATPPHTVILYKCVRCAQHLSYVVGGTWTVADLRRTEAEIKEITDLERIAGL